MTTTVGKLMIDNGNDAQKIQYDCYYPRVKHQLLGRPETQSRVAQCRREQGEGTQFPSSQQCSADTAKRQSNGVIKLLK